MAHHGGTVTRVCEAKFSSSKDPEWQDVAVAWTLENRELHSDYCSLGKLECLSSFDFGRVVKF